MQPWAWAEETRTPEETPADTEAILSTVQGSSRTEIKIWTPKLQCYQLCASVLTASVSIPEI